MILQSFYTEISEAVPDALGLSKNLVSVSSSVDVENLSKAVITKNHERLAQFNSILSVALNNMGCGLSMFDSQQRLIICNDHYRNIYLLPEEVTQSGMPFVDIIRYHAEQELNRSANDSEVAGFQNWIDKHVEQLANKSCYSITHHLKDGRVIHERYQSLPSGGWVDLVEDITDRRRTEEQISYLATHDCLTKLANRHRFCEIVDLTLQASRKLDRKFALLLLDLDRFKQVNDMLGHPAGDELLKMVARRIESCTRMTSTAARLGGDEFAIWEPIGEPGREVGALAKRLIAQIDGTYDIDGHQITIGASLGVAIAPTDGSTTEELMKKADLALYRAKKEGGGNFCFFEVRMDQELRRRQKLEIELRAAIANKEFELYYQPIVNIKSNAISGCEALLRWNHPKNGLVSPADFMPVAEETGLMVPIGEWVLHQAFLDAAKWPANVRVAVNLSPAQIRSDRLLDVIQSALQTSGLSPNRVEIEITESAVLDSKNDKIQLTLQSLRDIGIGIALDDFGTGFSSLSHVRTLPIDRIKIDGSFVREITCANSKSLAIVKAVMQLARGLGLQTTAECIETEKQLSVMQAEDCTEMQGYYFSRPKPIEQIAEMMCLEMAL